MYIILCISSSHLQIAVGALADLSQHIPEAVADAGAILQIVRTLENQDPKLKVPY